MMRSTSALLASSLVVVSTAAMAQESERDNSPKIDTAERAKTVRTRLVGGVAVLGTYREIYDLSAFGVGAELTLGGEGAMHGGYYHLRLVRGETRAGLTVNELATLGTYELHVSGLRFGVGGGVTLLSISRATTQRSIDKLGMSLLGRVGYDFGERSGPYVLGQVEWQTQHSWGPTLCVGYRF